MGTLLFALGFVSLTRVRIQQTGCLVQSLRLLGFIHNTYDSYQLPNYVWNTAKIVFFARGKFGKAALPLVNDLYCKLTLYNGWLPSWELTHIPLKVTTLSRWFSQLPQVGYGFVPWRITWIFFIQQPRLWRWQRLRRWQPPRCSVGEGLGGKWTQAEQWPEKPWVFTVEGTS